MKKYISTALVFAALLSAGCYRTAKTGVKKGGEIAETGITLIKRIGSPDSTSTKKAAGALMKFIQAAGENGNAVETAHKAGKNYVKSQQNNANLISKSRLENVIYETLLEEVDKTATQITKAELKDVAAEIAVVILAPVNDEEETE